MARLLVLWLLSENPSHGYQIKKSLSDAGMNFWFRLEDASIYSVLRTLTKNGYAVEIGTEQVDNRPRRTRYAITAEGRTYYRSMLTEALATPTSPVSMIDVALAARGDLDASAISDALDVRRVALNSLEATMEACRLAAPSAALVDRNLAIVRAEQQWLRDLDQTSIT